ncbi:MAG: hypothetical protein RL728_739, partial [Bacteroidota bacterium]
IGGGAGGGDQNNNNFIEIVSTLSW